METGEPEIRAFLSHLAVEGNVTACTQNVALNALLFLYRDVLKKELQRIHDIERAKRPRRLPVVFTPEEVRAVLGQLKGTYLLMASLLYGSGLRLVECLRLRVKDLDKGEKDRVRILPRSMEDSLQRQEKVRI